MINLKMTKRQAKKRDKVLYGPSSDSEYSYPWGTRVSFEKPEIDKIKALQGVNAGDKVVIQAVGKVVEVRVTDAEDGRAHHSVEIQLQKVHIGNQDEEDAAFNEGGGDEY